MSVSINRCYRRARLTDELVENWQFDHREAMVAYDCEVMISECLELVQLVEETWGTIKKHLFDDSFSGDIDGRREMFLMALEWSSRALKRILETANDFCSKGYDLDRIEELRDALPDFEKLSKAVISQWPTVDDQMVKDSEDAYKHGAWKSSEDLLRDAHSNSS